MQVVSEKGEEEEIKVETKKRDGATIAEVTKKLLLTR